MLLSITGTGCFTAVLSRGARDSFVQGNSCPPDRVSVVAIPDYQDPLPPDPPPPADVAADAGRLAVWRQQHEAARKEGGQWQCSSTDLLGRPDRTMYEVTGCGQRQVYCCHHPSTNGRTDNMWEAECSAVTR